ncbi:hypothetical protein N7481_002526 [Penicillium waksmanii]|uniref:uncharacterized protein n=1 Tax=Penicillium waksmanii TaxID=69791 RepID=UPI002547EC48|nr:uncharacterized protein N7481_002526 [Penicillium waksmanii]KAJ5995549.1 hypothetical protein N7481_002526 [Penicillium waksmanii]
MSEQDSPHHQRLQDPNNQIKQRPYSSNGSPQSFALVQGPPTAASNNLPSSTVHQVQKDEAENNPSLSSVQYIPDVDSTHVPLQIHPNSNWEEGSESYMPDRANHAGLRYNDYQTASAMLEYPTETDYVELDLFAGIGDNPDDWDIFFGPLAKGELSTDNYSTPFYYYQPLPFDYAS